MPNERVNGTHSRCARCAAVKPFKQFPKLNPKKDGTRSLGARCTTCRESMTNRDNRAAACRRSYQLHHADRLLKQRERYRAHRKEHLEKGQKYRKNHPEALQRFRGKLKAEPWDSPRRAKVRLHARKKSFRCTYDPQKVWSKDEVEQQFKAFEERTKRWHQLVKAKHQILKTSRTLRHLRGGGSKRQPQGV